MDLLLHFTNRYDIEIITNHVGIQQKNMLKSTKIKPDIIRQIKE